jgi:hypothetical protein
VEVVVGTITGAMDWTKLLENTGIPLDSAPARLAIWSITSGNLNGTSML